MIQTIFNIAFLLPIILLLVAGVLSYSRTNISFIKILTTAAPLLGLVTSILASVWIFNNGMIESITIGYYELGFSLRFDQLSILMFGMVSVIAMVIIRFSENYLDGDSRHVVFIGRLSITLALVQLLLLSGNIFLLWASWVATSLALHQLLVFYPERRKAKLAATKKFIVARIGDVTFLIALGLIYTLFETGNLESIFQQINALESSTIPFQLELAAILLVITAGLKSAQIPFHGWLLEVMEAPTPVSALLHAGLLNAGPFLMIRFSHLLDVTSVATILLFTMGAVTALYGALVFTTQPSIKTSLAYSSVAHMGFTLMVCGLGVYSASLLHLIAHSFYKAHSFLSSGSVVEKVRTKQASNYERKGSVWRILVAFALAIFMFITIAEFWKVNTNTEYQVLIIGGIIFTGIISLLINTLDSSNYKFSIIILLGATITVLMSFFSLEQLMHYYLGSQIPVLSQPTQFMMYLSGGTLIIFFLTVLVKALSPLLQRGIIFKNFGVHVRNGFYLNVMVDGLIDSFYQKTSKN